MGVQRTWGARVGDWLDHGGEDELGRAGGLRFIYLLYNLFKWGLAFSPWFFYAFTARSGGLKKKQEKS